MKATIRKILFVFITVLFGLNVFSQDNYVVVFGKLKVEWGSLDNTNIRLYEDGKEIDSYDPEKSGKFQFTIELNHEYKFWFTKPGYVTKKVQFNSTVPESVTSDPEFIPFPDFDFYVTLFESFPEVDTMFFSKPVGKIQYDAKTNDFGWDKNYTLEIQRRMEEIEKDIKQKYEQKILEEEKQQELAEQNAMKAQAEKEEAEKQAKLEKERLAKEEKDRIKAEKEAQKQAEIEAQNAQKIAKAKEKEEQRLAQIEAEQQKEEEKRLEKLAEQEAEELNEKQKREQKQTEQELEEQQKLAKQNEKARIDEENKAKEEEVAKSEQNEPEQIQTEVTQAEIKRDEKVEELSAVPAPVENKSFTNVPAVKTQNTAKKTYGSVKRQVVQKVDVAGKTTTKKSITENGVTLIYVKVSYTWGGKFFFIEEEPGAFKNISETYYNRKTAGN